MKKNSVQIETSKSRNSVSNPFFKACCFFVLFCFFITLKNVTHFLLCSCVFKVRVPEDTSPWKDILQISAQDADANSKLVYSIHSSLHPDSTKFFHLDPKSGVLVMTEELDYEMISVHTLIVMVMTVISVEYTRIESYEDICNVY